MVKMMMTIVMMVTIESLPTAIPAYRHDGENDYGDEVLITRSRDDGSYDDLVSWAMLL